MGFDGSKLAATLYVPHFHRPIIAGTDQDLPILADKKISDPFGMPLMGLLSPVEAMIVSFEFGILKPAGCFDHFEAIRQLSG